MGHAERLGLPQKADENSGLEDNSFESKLENISTGCICNGPRVEGGQSPSLLIQIVVSGLDHTEEDPCRKYRSLHSQQSDSALLSPCLKIYFAHFCLKWFLLVGLIFSIFLTLPLSDQFSFSSAFDLCSSVNYVIHSLLTFLQVPQRISQLSYEAEQNNFRYSLILHFSIGSTFPSPVCRYSALVKGLIKNFSEWLSLVFWVK